MTLKQIQERLAEIKKELDERGEDLTEKEIEARETEIAELIEKRTALISGNERRAAMLETLAENTQESSVVRSFGAIPTPAPDAQAENRAADTDDIYGTLEYRNAFMRNVMRGEPMPAEYRDAAVTHTTDVGLVIPTVVLNQIIEKMEAVGMILPLVSRRSFRGGLNIPISTVKPVATWVAEGKGSDAQKLPTGQIEFKYHKLRCAVAVTLEVETMALSAFESMLVRNIVKAMVKALEDAIINGDGNGKPKGILAETVVTGQKVDSTAPSYQDLLDAEAALPVEYENNARWCMTKKTFMLYFGLTDDTGQPIGRVNYGIANRPERFLLGRPVAICNYIDSFTPTLAANKPFTFLFDFEDYMLNTNYQMGVKKYEDNDTDDWITRALMLVDGKVTDKNSLVKIVKK